MLFAARRTLVRQGVGDRESDGSILVAEPSLGSLSAYFLCSDRFLGMTTSIDLWESEDKTAASSFIPVKDDPVFTSDVHSPINLHRTDPQLSVGSEEDVQKINDRSPYIVVHLNL